MHEIKLFAQTTGYYIVCGFMEKVYVKTRKREGKIEAFTYIYIYLYIHMFANRYVRVEQK